MAASAAGLAAHASNQHNRRVSPTPAPNATAARVDRLAALLDEADAVVVGAGAGLSIADGDAHSGPVFAERFADFIARYGFTDAYTAGFHPFASPEEKWAYWSRHISLLRYETGPGAVYADLLALLDGRDFFVLTTNVDHRFQKAGLPKDRLFYTQGDYGLFQCSAPCHDATYDNADAVAAMVREQRDMRVPAGLVPRCPRCGEPMSTNLRADATFVQDAGWHTAADRCARWLRAHGDGRVLYLELGVGTSTPAIIRHPFWQRTYLNERAAYAGISLDPVAPREIAERSVLIDADLAPVLARLACRGATSTGPQTSGRPSGI